MFNIINYSIKPLKIHRNFNYFFFSEIYTASIQNV